MKFVTRVEESEMEYSCGGVCDDGPDSIIEMDSRIPSLVNPDISTQPDSSASGLSIESLIVTAGNPKITASSLTEPLSERTTLASSCNLL